MNQEKIGKFITTLRKEKNLTQEELANKLSITKNAVSKWERGISLMDMSLLKPLCEILDISITELLNGERIVNENLKDKTDDVIKDTIDYTNKKIKKNKIKNVIFTIMGIIILTCILYFGYKLYLLNKYTLEKPENVSEIVEGLKNQSEIKIYKRTLNEEDYLVLSQFKIRNDFKEYTKVETDNELMPDMYQLEKDGITYGITFSTEVYSEQLINQFTTDDIEFYGEFYEQKGENVQNKFTSADRKFFLLKNDINNDIDFYKYVADNYYKENNIFMDKRTLMENYAFNLFTSISVPKVDSIMFIKGDYEGYILKINKIIQVTIIRENKLYGFMTNDLRFQDEIYLKDILSTIEIK